VSELQPLLRKTSGLPSDIEPSMYDANIYEIVSMYVDAVKKTGIKGDSKDLEADRVKIRDYMENLKGYEGFSGPIHFGPSGDAVKTFFIVQGQNGAWETKLSGCSASGGGC
jgi:branched-chain amino acid transport system substrate-binding protein